MLDATLEAMIAISAATLAALRQLAVRCIILTMWVVPRKVLRTNRHLTLASAALAAAAAAAAATRRISNGTYVKKTTRIIAFTVPAAAAAATVLALLSRRT